MIQDINKVLSRKGYNQIHVDHAQMVQEYLSFYRGDVDGFHEYTEKVQGDETKFFRKSMNMPKIAAKDKTSLIFGEKFDIQVENEQELLDGIFAKNNFYDYTPQFYEKVIGYAGYGFFIEFEEEDGDVFIDFITSENSYVIGHTNAIINKVLTVSQETEMNGQTKIYYNNLVYHVIEDGIYTITNEVYKSEDDQTLGTLLNVDEWPKQFSDLKETTSKETTVPQFQIVQANLANNHDVDAPYTIPYIANARDTSKAIDELWDLMVREFKLKRARVLLASSAKDKNFDSEGIVVQRFDETNELYELVNMENGEEPIKEINTGEYRVTNFKDGININLKIFSKQFGLGDDFYSFDQKTGLQTATGVVSDKSELFRNKRNDEKVLELAFIGMVQAIGSILGVDFGEVTVTFDDSIIIDDEAEMKLDLTLVANNMMSKVRFLMEHKGLSETEATQWIAETNTESVLTE